MKQKHRDQRNKVTSAAKLARFHRYDRTTTNVIIRDGLDSALLETDQGCEDDIKIYCDIDNNYYVLITAKTLRYVTLLVFYKDNLKWNTFTGKNKPDESITLNTKYQLRAVLGDHNFEDQAPYNIVKKLLKHL